MKKKVFRKRYEDVKKVFSKRYEEVGVEEPKVIKEEKKVEKEPPEEKVKKARIWK